MARASRFLHRNCTGWLRYSFFMEVEYFTFTLPPDAWRKKPQPSTIKLTRSEAAKRYPGATPILASREVRLQDGPKLIPGGSAYGQ